MYYALRNKYRFNNHVNYMYCDPAAHVLADKIFTSMNFVQESIPPAIIMECSPNGAMNTMSHEVLTIHFFVCMYCKPTILNADLFKVYSNL